MTDAFLKKKWERVFYTFFDINRNKKIDWNDFEMIFDKIKELRGEDSTEYKIASDAMGAVWKGLLQATKGIDMAQEVPADIEITLEEWDEIWKKFDPNHMHIWQWEYLKYMFFLLDSSGDKVIDRDEYADVMKLYDMKQDDAFKAFDACCQKIKELRGEDSTEYKIASDAMGAVWKGLLQATKGLDMADEVPADIEITIEEWDTIWKKFDPNHMHIWQWEYLKYMFFLLDSSGDKVIDRDEYAEVMKLYNMKKEDAHKAFDACCQIEKGCKQIDYGKFVRLWNQFFTSKDKAAPGNTLFGPL